MPTVTVSVINGSTVVTDEQCQALIAALQIQVTRDFEPAWGVGANLVFVPRTGTPVPGSWWLSILDTTDRPGMAGHHEATSEGMPIAKCFAGTDIQYGMKWTVTASHELLEMLANPYLNRTVFVHPVPGQGKLYTYEICDPCQHHSFGYEINGLPVCDFVYPVYFDSLCPPGTAQFDHMNHLQAPLPALLPGGYINSFDVADFSRGWDTVSGEDIRPTPPAPSTSRRARRAIPPGQWRRSNAFQPN